MNSPIDAIFGVILVSWSLLGRFTIVPNFLLLQIMAHTVVHWRSGPVTLSRLIDVNDFVSHLFLSFFSSWHDTLLLEIL